MRIYLDFDGTVVEHNFPAIGAENPNAIYVISLLQKAGHNIVLNTYRADIDISYVQEALSFLNSHPQLSVPIENYLPKKLDPKPFDLVIAKTANQLYIDDIAEGIPLCRNKVLEFGMMVDWAELERLLQSENII
jgi:hypothetical protein